jgi:eukaryotic-like serine/threonine-protein kinase
MRERFTTLMPRPELTMSEPNRPEEFQKANGNSTSTPANGAGSTPSMPFDLTGLVLGEFHLLRRLGKGGMAEVWLSEQTSLRRQVAVKILRPDFVADANYVKRFKHEATAAGSLNHPNIVQVYMVGEENGIHFIAQEYVQGRNLKEFITRKGPLEVPIALHILKQVAAALQVAAASGIVHRDIKPENVLLTKKGEAKVADFGLAQLSLHGEKVALTQVGVTMGTPLYMSPEQVNGKTLDARSDIYSMGVMAWHMLAGRPPFSGESALAVAVKHLNEAPPSLKDVRPDVPPGVVALIERMMSKKKEDRPADAQAVANDLKSLLRQATGKETPPSEAAFRQDTLATRSKTPFLERSLRRQMWWMIGASLLVMASTSGIGWTMRTPDPFKTPVTAKSTAVRQSTVEGQVYRAQGMAGKPGVTMDDIEAAWIEVKTHPEATAKDKHRADLNLALIYLKTKRQKQAEEIFNALDASTDAWSRAHAKAGQALLAGLRREDATLRQLAEKAQALARQDSVKKLDPAIDEALTDALRRSKGPAK